MKKTLILFINIFLVLLVVACKKTEPTPTPEPKPEEKVYFTVEFDVNEGDVSIASQRVLENSYATLPTERPNKEGYSFSGWTITLDGEDYFDFTETKITENIKLYAKYEIIEIIENYDDSVLEWSKPDHFYIHYKRAADFKNDYDMWDIWFWQYEPVAGEGRTFNWIKYDQSGGVVEIDLTKTYYDGGTKQDTEVSYKNGTRFGFLIVLKSSKEGAGHWSSDGSNILVPGLNDDRTLDDFKKENGSYHLYIQQDNAGVYTNIYEDVEISNPYDDIEPGSAVSKTNVDSSTNSYTNFETPSGYSGVGYQIQVSSFADSDGDGFGDIKGITENIDYLEALNVDVLWLTPIQLSDSYHGYDIIDFYQIDPKFGTLGDFNELIYEANKRGIKILMDLVVNHTSLSNPWFIKSTQLVVEDDVEYRSFYNWKTNEEVSGLDSWYPYSNYGYSYYGKFASNMPELNYDYQPTRDAIVDVALYWMSFGLSGFRIDAVKHIYMEDEYSSNSKETDIIHKEGGGYDRNVTKNVNFFQEFSARVKSVYPHAFIVGENFDGSPDNVAYYYEGMDSQFDFSTYFKLRDEIDKDNAYDFAFGYQKELALYQAYRGDEVVISSFTSNHDISRALNYINGGNVDGFDQILIKKTKLWASVNLTLPGLSFIYYGDEIGMSGNTKLNDNGTNHHMDRWYRQPFLWEDESYRTEYNHEIFDITLDEYNKELANKGEQLVDSNSMLSHYMQLTNLKSNDDVLNKGDFKAIANLETGSILSYSRSYNGTTYYIYHNLKNESNNMFNPNNYQNIVWSSSGSTNTSILGGYETIILKG